MNENKLCQYMMPMYLLTRLDSTEEHDKGFK